MSAEDQDKVDCLQQEVPPTSSIALHHHLLQNSWHLACCLSVVFETLKQAGGGVLQQNA